MTGTITIPPMPATDCPSWCEQDHLADWTSTAEGLMQPGGYDFRQADGKIKHAGPATHESLLRTWEPLHQAPVESLELVDGDLVIEMLGCPGDAPELYVDCASPVTAAQARAVAHAFLRAAELLEAATA